MKLVLGGPTRDHAKKIVVVVVVVVVWMKTMLMLLTDEFVEVGIEDHGRSRQ